MKRPQGTTTQQQRRTADVDAPEPDRSCGFARLLAPHRERHDNPGTAMADANRSVSLTPHNLVQQQLRQQPDRRLLPLRGERQQPRQQQLELDVLRHRSGPAEETGQPTTKTRLPTPSRELQQRRRRHHARHAGRGSATRDSFHQTYADFRPRSLHLNLRPPEIFTKPARPSEPCNGRHVPKPAALRGRPAGVGSDGGAAPCAARQSLTVP